MTSDFTASELLVLQRAMAGVFLDEDAPLRNDIIRKLAKAEMEMARRRVMWTCSRCRAETTVAAALCRVCYTPREASSRAS